MKERLILMVQLSQILIKETILSLLLLWYSDIKHNQRIAYVIVTTIVCASMQYCLRQLYFYEGFWAILLILVRCFIGCIFQEKWSQSISRNLIFLFQLDGLYHLGKETLLFVLNLKYGILPMQIDYYFESLLFLAAIVFLVTGGSLICLLVKNYRQYHTEYELLFAVVFFGGFVIRVYVENIMYAEKVFLLRLLLINYSMFLMTSIMYYLYWQSAKRTFEKEQHTFLAQQLKNIQENEKIYAEKEKEIRMIKHDLKNELTIFAYQLQNGDIESVQKRLAEKMNKINLDIPLNQTGITVLDAVLTEKTLLAKEKGIPVKTIIQLGSLSDDCIYDLAMILANLLDNAIENNNLENPYLMIKIQQKRKLILHIENTTTKDDMNLQTKKKDRKNHGIGLQSVQTMIQKYHGFLLTNLENGIFIAQVELYLE